MTSAIEFRNVEKTYYLGNVQVPVIRGMSIEIGKGEYTSIVGPSGSGKSTMMNLVGCLDTPTAGAVLLEGKDISTLSEDELAEIRREKIGFVFQQFNLISKLTALENVTFPMWLKGISTEHRTKRATDLLRRVGLGERTGHRPAELSGGERQRVAIARALANSPQIILADEPTGNLDSKTGKEITDLLIRLHKKDKLTLVMITHDLKLAAKAHHIIRIRDGKVVKEDKK